MNFNEEFEAELKSLFERGVKWDLVGILTKSLQVYTLSYDSKILSGIFEILCEPLIQSIADRTGMKLEKAGQTTYPEFTLIDPKRPGEKIAIDIKSTYRQRNKNNSIKSFAFTLGSYRSYLQDPHGKKSILYPYSEYSEHWVIGFLYDRNPNCKLTNIRPIIEASQLEPPFLNIEYFIQQKFRIAGKATGSGNTTNIGSIKSNRIEDFREGKGGFASQSEFESYWKNFKK